MQIGNESGFSDELYLSLDDEIPDFSDNCPDSYNPDQEDTYPPGGNDRGNICDCEGDFNCDGDVDGGDSTIFKEDFGRSAFNDPCTSLHPCNGDFNCDHNVDSNDVIKFNEDFGRNLFNKPCPPCEVGEYCTYE